MHAFLLSKPPDLPESPNLHHVTPEKSIGIDDIRDIQHFLSRKPLGPGSNTIIIHEAEKLTLPAQHAILKILEEPPGDSLIYLVSSQPDSLLPTVLSRLTPAAASPPRITSQPDTSQCEKLFRQLQFTENLGEKLAIIDSAEFSRESALKFLDQLEHLLHRRVGESTDTTISNSTEIYELLHRTRIFLKANVNVRLAMDNFAIDFFLGGVKRIDTETNNW